MPTKADRLWAENDSRLTNDTPEIIRQLRVLAGLSQASLAARLGVHRTTVARWETGVLEPPPWVLLALRGIEAE